MKFGNSFQLIARLFAVFVRHLNLHISAGCPSRPGTGMRLKVAKRTAAQRQPYATNAESADKFARGIFGFYE